MKQYGSISYLLSSVILISLIGYAVISVNLERDRQIQGIQNKLDLSRNHWNPGRVPLHLSSPSEVLALNRIPNCGGEVLVLILEWLQHTNGFKHHRLKTSVNGKNSELEKRVHEIATQNGRNSFDTTFIFQDFGTNQIAHISLLRHPLDRISSLFYYDSVTPVPGSAASDNYPKKQMEYPTIESCIRNYGDQCHFDKEDSPILSLRSFCGESKICRKHNDRKALKKAKANIVNHHTVVGTLENLNVTLSVLESKLPEFFQGALELLENITKNKNWKPNMPIPPMKPWAKAYMKKHLRNEIELYEFVTNRLHEQL